MGETNYFFTSLINILNRHMEIELDLDLDLLFYLKS